MKAEVIKNKTWIFLPVEVKVRELIPKMLLTYFALRAGLGIFIGRNGMNIGRDFFPRGVYFDKCLSKHKLKFHEQQVFDLGNALVSFDEEGLLFWSEKKYLDERVTQESLNLSRLIFLWGPAQKRLIQTHLNAPDEKLVLTSGPRVDLWGEEFIGLFGTDIKHLKTIYGDFILIVSNWGYLAREREIGRDPDKAYPGDSYSGMRAAFIRLIDVISSAFPERTIVIRPHPKDIEEYWVEKSKNFGNNVEVVREGPIGPWIHAAMAVIHNNCTTGIEAWVGAVPTIVYSPTIEGRSDVDRFTMPINRLGMICRSEEEVRMAIQRSFEGLPIVPDLGANAVVDEFLSIKSDETASERIVRHLVELGIAPQRYKVPQYGFYKKMRAMVGQVKWRIKDLLGLSGMYTDKYTQQKNPGIQMWEINEWLSRLATHFDESPDFFEVRQVDKDTFCIYGKEPDPSA